MTDIADIGFRVDTSQLDKAVTKLNAITPAAAGVAASSTKMAAAVEGANLAIASSATAVARVEAQKATAMLKSLQANASSTKESIAAARAIQLQAKATLSATLAEENRVQALNKVANAQRKVEAATNAAAATQAKQGPSLAVNNGPTIPRDMMPNRFNTGNIAAQFQDIGVTAAMGMNPLMIAMQQGTQLAAIMNSMEKPLQGLAVAFKQVLNVTSLMAIGLVALVAAGLQMVDWVKVGQAALRGLADIIEVTTPYIMGLGVALTLLYSRSILAGIASIGTYLLTLGATALAAAAKIAGAWVIAMGPIAWVIAGVVAIGAVFQMLGVDVIGYMKSAANGIIGAFVGAFNAVKETWKMLPAVMGDLVIQTANIVLSKISGMINGFVSMVNSLIEKLPEKLRPEGAKITWEANLEIANPFEGQAAAAGKAAGEEFNKAFNKDYVGAAIGAANSAGSSIAGSLRGMADGLGKDSGKGKAKGGKTEAEKYEDIIKGAQRRIETLKAEQAAIGMTEQATAKLKYETELLNQAQEKNIKLTPAQRAELGQLAEGMARIEEETRRTKEAMDFAKDATKGFFSDMKQGLQEGKSLWESFGNAVTNVLNKIFDRMMNSGIDMIFGGSGGSGGGGLLSSLFSLGGSGGAPIPGGVGPSQGTNGIFGSILGAFGFAKGGAFTNSIVNNPTPFTFASGGAFGVMGEAGPEAVMPLHRGSDGSLGVKMNGGGGGGTAVIVNINNYGDSKVSTQQRQTSNGTEIDVMIDEMVAKKISEQGSASNRSLDARDSRRLISR